MPLDDRVPGALDDWIERLRRWSFGRSRVDALVAGSGVAGGIEAAASAVGVGFNLTNSL
jgi:hypothetical protein